MNEKEKKILWWIWIVLLAFGIGVYVGETLG